MDTTLGAHVNRYSLEARGIAGRILKILYWVLCFLLPIGVLCVVCYLDGIYPFGQESFLTEDLKYQYIDFFTWFKHLLEGEGSVFYSFGQNLGNNTWGLFSYYLSSPFNLLIVFFDEDHLVDFVFVITALKLGCIGLSCTWYIRRRFKLGYFSSAALAIGFTWSIWVATQLRNPLWLDALILLPIVLYGIYLLVRRGAWKTFCFALMADIIICWYMGYMTVIFSILFLIFELLIFHIYQNRVTTVFVVNRCFRFCLACVIALCLSAFTFLPTVAARISEWSPQLSVICLIAGLLVAVVSVFAIRHTFLTRTCRIIARIFVIVFLVACVLAVASFVLDILSMGLSTFLFADGWRTFFETDFYNLIQGFLPGGWVYDKTPQLFCGTIVLILIVLFFFLRSIPWRMRLCGGIFLLIMMVSVVFIPFEQIWCGFQIPHGFYSRPALFASFLIIWIAACSVSVLSGKGAFGVKRKSVRKNATESTSGNFRLQLSKIMASTSFRSVISLLFLVVMVVDLSVSAVGAWPVIYKEYDQDHHDEYVSGAREEIDALKNVDQGFFRFDKTYTRTSYGALNEGMALGFSQISSYNSASNDKAVAFLNALGYSNEGEFLVRYADPMLLSDSLLGVKYVSTSLSPFGYKAMSIYQEGAHAKVYLDPDTHVFREDADAEVYLNPYALSLGYATSSAIETLSFDNDGRNPFERQNAFVSAILGEDTICYEPAPVEQTNDSGASQSWSIDVSPDSIVYAYVYDGQGTGASVYLTIDDGLSFSENWRFEHAVLEVGGESLDISTEAAESIEGAEGAEAAEVSEGTEVAETNRSLDDNNAQSHTVVLATSDGSDIPEGMTCLFYSLNLSTFENVIDRLSQQQFVPQVFKDGYVEGIYEADSDGLLLMSIPADSGWTIMVNNAEVSAQEACGGALTIVPVTAGENNIVMTYVSPGFIPGVVITVFTIALLALVLAIGRKRRMYRIYLSHNARKR